MIPTFMSRWLHRLRGTNAFLPPPGHVDFGDLKRAEPFSRVFGYDRGGPVDRHYIEKFLTRTGGDIKGRVLEIGDNEYTLRFGGSRVTQSDILHVDATNAKATFIGDLTHVPQVPSDAFDCIVLTQTLHLVYDYRAALATCHRVLKPGGVLLLTTPGISHIDHHEWGHTWYWSFTDRAVKRMMAEAFPGGRVDVQTHGNVFVCTAFLYGLGAGEIDEAQYERTDPDYQLVTTVRAVKHG